VDQTKSIFFAVKIEFLYLESKGRMVCFVVEILLPVQQRECNNAALQRRIEHLAHHTNASIWNMIRYDDQNYYQFRVCDEDTMTLLRDFPTPFSVLQINYLHSNENLYTYRKHHSPPTVTLLKQIYWLAKSTERWKLPIWNVQPQTK
jgi:hypothetical protein